MRIVFMGTPEFSIPALDALVEAGHEVVAVYCQPPRKSGRGQKERPTPVHSRSLDLGLEVRHPTSLKSAEEQVAFAALDPDIAVVVAYGLILPQPVLEAPKRGCLNIHASLLPRWRGAAPIHRAIMAGDRQTGVCIMQMDAGLDTGPVLLRRTVDIGAEDTTGDLHEILSKVGAEAVVETLGMLDALKPEQQPLEGVTYAKKIDKAEARTDWTLPAAEVDRHIRGLSPFPGAWCEIGGERVKLLGCRLIADSGMPGEVLGGFRVACGDGAVEVTRAQRLGKRAMEADDLLRGWNLPERLA